MKQIKTMQRQKRLFGVCCDFWWCWVFRWFSTSFVWFRWKIKINRMVCTWSLANHRLWLDDVWDAHSSVDFSVGNKCLPKHRQKPIVNSLRFILNRCAQVISFDFSNTVFISMSIKTIHFDEQMVFITLNDRASSLLMIRNEFKIMIERILKQHF